MKVAIQTIAFTIGGLLLLAPLFAFAYSDSTTHPDLSAQAGMLYNYRHPDEPLTRKQIELMTEGSYKEDIAPRFVNHFYDPTTGNGWSAHKAERFAESNFSDRATEFLQRWFATTYEPLPATQWVADRQMQGGAYGLFGGDKTWWQALEYALEGEWDEAYRTLGYVIHLAQDASVPAHTRDDSHADGDTYESWAKDHSLNSGRRVNVAQKIVNAGVRVPQFSTPAEAIAWVAEYSNANFLSDDTILNGYKEPRIAFVREKRIDEGDVFAYAYRRTAQGDVFPLVLDRSNPWDSEASYDLDDGFVMSAYWDRLSKRAVLASVGLLELFHREVAERQESNEKLPQKASSQLSCSGTGIMAIKRAQEGRCNTAILNASPLSLIGGPFKRGVEELARIVTNTVNALAGNRVIEEGIGGVGHPDDGHDRTVIADLEPPAEEEEAEEEDQQQETPEEEQEQLADEPQDAEPEPALPEEDETDDEPAEPETFLVERIFDGDTVQLATGRVVRYMSIDAPEVEHDGTTAECLADAATELNADLVAGQRIRIETNPDEEKDTHGRLLGYVFLEDGTFVNERLVRDGLAETLFIPPRGEHDDALASAETAAQDAERGIWGAACAPEPEEEQQDEELEPVTVNSGTGGSGGGGYRPPPSVEMFTVELPGLNLGVNHDEDPGTAGVQVTVSGDAKEGTTVTASHNPIVETVADEHDRWSLSLSLPPGETTVTFGGAVPTDQPLEPVVWDVAVDMTTPNAVDDFSAETGSLMTSWTAQNDPYPDAGFASDAVSFYEIRFSEDALTTGNWASASLAGSVTASASLGAEESHTFNDFDPGDASEINVAVRAYDKAGNASDLSNIETLEFDYTANHIVISEVMIEGDAVRDEFIELYNPTDQTVDIEGWELRRQKSTGTEENLIDDGAMAGEIPPHGYFLIRHPDIHDGNPGADLFFSGSSFTITPDNTIILYDGDHKTGTIVDRVGFGSATNPEGTAFATNPDAKESIERVASNASTAETLASGNDRWAGNGWDSDDNSADFVLQTIPNPQNSNALAEPHSGPPTMADASAPVWRVDPGRSGWFSNVAGPLFTESSASVKWSETFASTSLSAQVAVTEDEDLLVGGNMGVLHVLRDNGSVKTTLDVSSLDTDFTTVGATPAATTTEDRLYLAVEGNRSALYALDDGFEPIWRFDIGSGHPTDPLILETGDVAFVEKNTLYVVDPNGSVRYKIASGAPSNVAFDGSGFIVTKDNGLPTMHKIMRYTNDGTLDWEVPTDPEPNDPAVAEDGTILFGTSFSRLYAYDSTGVELWDAQLSMSGDVKHIAANDEMAVVVGRDGKLLEAVDLSDGSLLWSFNDGAEMLTAPIIDDDGTVYVGSESGTVFALGNENGGSGSDVLWLLDLGEAVEVSAPPVLTGEGDLIVVTSPPGPAADDGFTVYSIGE